MTGALTGHAIIAGFGLPGRAVADLLAARHMSFCIIELNPATVERCSHTGVPIIKGDVSHEDSLVRAGIDRASLLALTVPDDKAVLAAIPLARRLHPGIRILARCRYVSTALEAARRGADQVIAEEQVVAEEFGRLLGPDSGDGRGANGGRS